MTAAPASEVVRQTPSPGRQHCLRDSGSEDWAAGGRGGRSNGREQREGLEVDPEATQSEERKDCYMERPDQVKGNVVVDIGEAVGQDLEMEPRTEQCPSREKEDGYRGETVAKEEDVQGGGADPPRGCSKEGEYPGGSRRTAEEGETAEKTEEIEFNRSPPVAASTETRQDIMSSPIAPTAQIIEMQGLLRRWASGGLGGLACEVRARSTEEQPSHPDQEVSRGRSMR